MLFKSQSLTKTHSIAFAVKWTVQEAAQDVYEIPAIQLTKLGPASSGDIIRLLSPRLIEQLTYHRRVQILQVASQARQKCENLWRTRRSVRLYGLGVLWRQPIAGATGMK